MALWRIALVSIKWIVREITRQISWVMSISLENAIQNWLLSLTAYGWTEQRNLPSWYTQLDGLVFDGSSYIDTGLTSFSNEGIYECDIITSTLATAFLFGQNPNLGSQQVGFFATTSNFVWQFDDRARLTVSISPNTSYNIIAENGKITVNGTEATRTAATEIIINQNLFVGAGVTPSSNAPDSRMFTGTIKRFKYSLSGEIKCNLIPAKRNSDNVLGMYDTVSWNFLTNSWTGTFTAWPNATPTPEAPMDIVSNNGVLKFWVVSKNLLDMSESNIVLGKYINNSWQELDSPYNFYNSKYIPVKPSTIYTWSTSVKVSYLSIMEYDSNKQFLQRTLFTNDATTLSDDITLRADTAYVLLWSNMDSNNITYAKISAVDWQFEEWDTTTSYVPYEEWIYADGVVETIEDELWNTATAEMLLKVGNYTDEQEILSWNITRNVGVKVLDGTENWVKGSSQIANYSFWTDDANFAILTDRTILCTHFQSSQTLPSATPADRNNKIWRGTSDVEGTQASICIGYNFNSTVAQFKQRLADQYAAWTPVIVVYTLATPTTETVTGQTMNIQAWNNTIEITQASIDDLELSAEYKALPSN